MIARQEENNAEYYFVQCSFSFSAYLPPFHLSNQIIVCACSSVFDADAHYSKKIQYRRSTRWRMQEKDDVASSLTVPYKAMLTQQVILRNIERIKKQKNPTQTIFFICCLLAYTTAAQCAYFFIYVKLCCADVHRSCLKEVFFYLSNGSLVPVCSQIFYDLFWPMFFVHSILHLA